MTQPISLKQQEFITTVQTAIIVSFQTGHFDPKDGWGSMAVVLTNMRDVFNYSSCIPDEMSANEAAGEYIGYMRTHPDKLKESDKPKWIQ